MRCVTLLAFEAEYDDFGSQGIGFVLHFIAGMVNHLRTAGVAVDYYLHRIYDLHIGLDIAAEIVYSQVAFM